MAIQQAQGALHAPIPCGFLDGYARRFLGSASQKRPPALIKTRHAKQIAFATSQEMIK
jgi:hypothetical protein